MTIYLAGKVSGIKHELAKLVPGPRYVCSDGSNHSEHEFGIGCGNFDVCDEAREPVLLCAIEPIRACDFLVAYLASPDSFGSIAEIAYASACGKRCYVLIETQDDGWENPLLDAYWFVCSFPFVQHHLVTDVLMGAKILEGVISASSDWYRGSSMGEAVARRIVRQAR